MPTFTTIALDRYIEPKPSKPMAAGKNVTDSSKRTSINGTDKQPDSESSTTLKRKNHWTQISPALYATPEPAPLPELPDSPSAFSSSPYIVNHKRRGPRLSKAFSEDDATLRQALNGENSDHIVKNLEAEDVEFCRVEESEVKYEVNEELGNDNISNDLDDFFDPQDSLSVKSSTDEESGHGLERSLNLNTSGSEFYDAWEELSSESGSQPSSNDIETELREIRLNLSMEMEKRKQAEDQINNMQSEWGRIREQLSHVGLNLPTDSDDIVEDLSRQIHLIRFVSNSIGRGVAKAELEPQFEAQLESKNFEIARLLDRLRYYEAVNREMSQRNQETIETMRSLRQKRKRRQRWIWGSVIAMVTVGSAALALSYLPSGKESSSSSHTPETSRSARR